MKRRGTVAIATHVSTDASAALVVALPTLHEADVTERTEQAPAARPSRGSHEASKATSSPRTTPAPTTSGPLPPCTATTRPSPSGAASRSASSAAPRTAAGEGDQPAPKFSETPSNAAAKPCPPTAAHPVEPQRHEVRATHQSSRSQILLGASDEVVAQRAGRRRQHTSHHAHRIDRLADRQQHRLRRKPHQRRAQQVEHLQPALARGVDPTDRCRPVHRPHLADPVPHQMSAHEPQRRLHRTTSITTARPPARRRARGGPLVPARRPPGSGTDSGRRRARSGTGCGRRAR